MLIAEGFNDLTAKFQLSRRMWCGETGVRVEFSSFWDRNSTLLNFFNLIPPLPVGPSVDEPFTADRSCLPELDSLYSTWIERCRYHERNMKDILRDRVGLIRQGYGCVYNRCF